MAGACSGAGAERVNGSRVLQRAGLHEHSFYGWRQRLRAEAPVSFALVKAGQSGAEGSAQSLDLVLKGGERLRIPLEESALRLVLRVVRALA